MIILEILAIVVGIVLMACTAGLGYKVRQARKELSETMVGWDYLDPMDQRKMLIAYLRTAE